MSTFLRDDATFAAIAGGDLPAASKSDQQTGTSVTTVVTPGHQQDHDSAAKVWASITGATGAIQASYNVTSVTRNGAGDYTLTFTTNFANTNYAVQVTQEQTAGGQGFSGVVKNAGRATSTVRVLIFNSVFAAVDPTSLFVVCHGRQ